MKERMELQSRLQKAYGNAPQEYRLEIRKACGQLEEGPRVRKASGLAVAFAMCWPWRGPWRPTAWGP